MDVDMDMDMDNNIGTDLGSRKGEAGWKWGKGETAGITVTA